MKNESAQARRELIHSMVEEIKVKSTGRVIQGIIKFLLPAENTTGGCKVYI